MTDITLGTFLGYSGNVAPTRSTPTVVPNTGYQARYAGSQFGAGGAQQISGRAYSLGVPVERRVIILTQPPNTRVVYESPTLIPGATFSFPQLPAGRYVVVDCAIDGSERAMVYDWIAPV